MFGENDDVILFLLILLYWYLYFDFLGYSIFNGFFLELIDFFDYFYLSGSYRIRMFGIF